MTFFDEHYLFRAIHLDQVSISREHAGPDSFEGAVKTDIKLTENKSLEEMISEIRLTPKGPYWISRILDKTHEFKEVDIEKLILGHTTDKVPDSSGKPVILFVEENQLNQDTQTKIQRVINTFDIHHEYSKYLPIIADDLGAKYSIIQGNHRAMAYYKKGFKKVPVIVCRLSAMSAT